jgi:hypothetical protein
MAPLSAAMIKIEFSTDPRAPRTRRLRGMRRFLSYTIAFAVLVSGGCFTDIRPSPGQLGAVRVIVVIPMEPPPLDGIFGPAAADPGIAELVFSSSLEALLVGSALVLVQTSWHLGVAFAAGRESLPAPAPGIDRNVVHRMESAATRRSCGRIAGELRRPCGALRAPLRGACETTIRVGRCCGAGGRSAAGKGAKT